MKLTDAKIKQLKNAAKSRKNKLLKFLDLAKNGERISGKDFWLNIGDIADQIKICNVILTSNFRRAANLVQNLDTVVREDMPSCIYNFAYEY